MHEKLALACLAMAIAGCAVAPVGPPENHQNTPIYVSTAIPPSSRHKYGNQAIADSFFGVSKAGPLLGPLLTMVVGSVRTSSAAGAASNPLQPTLALNLGDLLAQQLPAYPALTEGNRSTEHFEIVPTADLFFLNDDTFRVQCRAENSLFSNGKRLWSYEYSVQLQKPTYSLSSPTVNDDLQSHLKDCFRRIMDVVVLHRNEGDSMLQGGVVESLRPGRLVYYIGTGITEVEPPAPK